MKRYIIAVDLDGVIAYQEHGAPHGLFDFGKPIDGIREFLLDLHIFADIIIYTCRCTPVVMGEDKTSALLSDVVREWLKDNDIFYNEIYRGVGKPFAHVYLDDSAVYVPRNPSKEELQKILVSVKRVCEKERVFDDNICLEREAATGGTGYGVLHPYIQENELLLFTLLTIKCSDKCTREHKELIQAVLAKSNINKVLK